MWYVYILFSPSSGKTYVGFSNDVDRRLVEHNITETSGFTLRYRPWVLIWKEAFELKAGAMKREKYLKTGKGREEVKVIKNNFLEGTVSAAAEKDWKSLCRRFDPAPHHEENEAIMRWKS